MSFSKEWEKVYQDNYHMSVWPWSDLISSVRRYTDINKEYKVLELGCGAGANIPFFQSVGCDYYAIEGSQTIVTMLKKKFPNYEKNIIHGDFTKQIPFNVDFDLVVDRSALTNNTTKDIERSINNIFLKLKINGAFIGIDWFSTNDDNYNYGDEIEDQYTKGNAREGYFVGLGNAHFSDRKHMEHLFRNFNIQLLEEKISTDYIPNNSITARWNIVCKK